MLVYSYLLDKAHHYKSIANGQIDAHHRYNGYYLEEMKLEPLV